MLDVLTYMLPLKLGGYWIEQNADEVKGIFFTPVCASEVGMLFSLV